MTCKNCGENSDGIRVNGKTFCTSCGELMQVEEALVQAAPVSVPVDVPVFPTEQTPVAPQYTQAPIEIPTTQPEPVITELVQPPADLSAVPIDQEPISQYTQPAVNVAVVEPEPQALEPASYSPETFEPDAPTAKFITPSGAQELATDTLGAELEVLDMFDEVAQNTERNEQLNEHLNTLEAEIEVLDKLEKLPDSTLEIQKSNRARIHKNQKGYTIIDNEPDPIEEPELPVPEDMLVEEESEDQTPITESVSVSPIETAEPTIVGTEDIATIEPEETPMPQISEAQVEQVTPKEELVTELVAETGKENYSPEPTPVIPVLEKEAELPKEEPAVVKPAEKPQKKPQYDVLKSNEYDWQEKTFVKKNKARAEAEVTGKFETEPNEEQEDSEEAPKPNNASKFFNNYIKNSLEETKPKKAPKKKKKNHKKLWLTLAIISVLLALFIGLGVYVNTVVLNPETSLQKAKITTNVAFQEPKYIPEGYKISAQTNATKESVELIYNFVNNSSRTISIKISKVVVTEDQLFNDYVRLKGQTFLNYQSGQNSFWYVSDSIFIFKDSNNVYEITSSDKMTKEEMQRIGEGVIIDNNDISS